MKIADQLNADQSDLRKSLEDSLVEKAKWL